MFGFIIRKLMNKKWMVISLLLGNLLLIAIAAANPMYSQAVMQRTLMQDMSDYMTENNTHPGTVVVRNRIAKFADNIQSKMDKSKAVYDELIGTLNVPAVNTVEKYTISAVYAVSDYSTEDNQRDLNIQVEGFSDIEEHINITHGELYSSELDDHTFDVIVSEAAYVSQSLILGEVWELPKIQDENGVPYKMRVTGIFEPKEDQDSYWLSSPSRWSTILIMDDQLLRDLFIDVETPQGFDITWYSILDYTAMRADEVDPMLAAVEKAKAAIEDQANVSCDISFHKILNDFVPKAQKLNTTVTVLQLPIMVLLAAFIFMVSRQMLETEQNEISVFKSRGAGRGQIIRMYIYQSVLIAVVGVAGGIPLGVCICKIIGASNAFLEFVQRSALPVEVNAKAWIYALAAALFSICTMVVPVLQFSKITIVAHKRQKNRKNKRFWWQTICLDLILLGVSFYGLYQFKSQEEYLAQKVLDGASLDPLLYACSSLFMVGAGLLILRLLPWLIKLVFWIGKKFWSPALYASFLGIMRTRSNQGFLVVFLVITVSMGIFNTQTARTINSNNEEKISYSIGADVVLMEKWQESGASTSSSGSSDDAVVTKSSVSYTEPDFGKYQEMDGIVQATKVLVDSKVTANVENGKVSNVTVMGIHTKEFGEVAWFKDNLLAAHWYEYLNAMSQNANAILVSSNFQEHYGYELGDIMTYTNENSDVVRGVIYGFVDYWPSYAPVTRTKGSDGVYRESENYLIVAHLSQLQSSWGVTPYQVWIKTDGSSQFLYDYAAETGTKFTMFRDADAELVDLKNDPVFQGTNGILTIGFIIVLVLCATGFLIYWILSIQSRTLQFGIYRAMGMSGREVLSMLVNEQIFISGVSICGGILVGKISATLFVPLIQVAYSSADKVLPLEIISSSSDYLRLGAVIGMMIVVCMIVLSVLISKIKITQALKLGED